MQKIDKALPLDASRDTLDALINALLERLAERAALTPIPPVAGYQQQGVTVYDASGNAVTTANPFPVASPGLPVDAANRPVTAQDLLDALALLSQQVQAAAAPAATAEVGSFFSVINPLDTLNAQPYDLAPISTQIWSGQNAGFW